MMIKNEPEISIMGATPIIAKPSQALDVDDAGAVLVVLGLGHPLVLEGAQRREDRPADPHGELALRRRDDADARPRCRRVRHARLDLPLQPRVEPRVHGRPAAQHHVLVQVAAHVDVALAHRVDDHVGERRRLVHPEQRRVEERLRAPVQLAPDVHHRAVGQLVLDRRLGARLRRGEVRRDERVLLLHPLRRRRLRAAQPQQQPHPLRQVPPGEVYALQRVRHRVPLVHRDAVRHAVARVEHDARHAPRRVERQHGLDLHVDRLGAEGLEHDARHLLAVLLRVERRLGEQDLVLARLGAQLLVEGVLPHPLHVLPVVDDAVLDRVLRRQHAALRDAVVAHVELAPRRARHDLRVPRAPDERREHRPRRVVAREARLHHPGAVVAHDGRERVVVVAGHGVMLLVVVWCGVALAQ
eukprot:CAMPEP_0174827150 /NCGR_PEP_ID=MMETSP1114-20130205/523_1 /TAXON_ID=312471 /ORGANISM="Neobodo designis, Strain CCAP 1951/1" /LENGTH=412 /DNA_ID=CAMNT_0016060757 /DNA_START=234 /DNA_END=1472 /DNA_ORIENTATION=-